MQATHDGAADVAEVYAQALLALAAQAGNENEVLEDLEGLTSFIRADADMAHFMSSPSVDADARQVTLEKLLGGKVSDLVLNTLGVLNAKGRAGIVPSVCNRYRLALEAHRGQLEVAVTSATALNDAQRRELTRVLESRTGKKVILQEDVDASLIGGLVVRVGDEKIDGSVASRLARIRSRMLDRASREIHADREYFQA